MPDTTKTEPIVKEAHIKASPETVFGYFTEPEKLTRWLCDAATSDPRPGGVIHQTHAGPADATDGPYYMEGEFTEVEHPSRIVFTWGFRNSKMGLEPGSTTVEVLLTPADGGTDLRLTHSGLEPGGQAEGHDGGWGKHLETLAGLEF